MGFINLCQEVHDLDKVGPVVSFALGLIRRAFLLLRKILLNGLVILSHHLTRFVVCLHLYWFVLTLPGVLIFFKTLYLGISSGCLWCDALVFPAHRFHSLDLLSTQVLLSWVVLTIFTSGAFLVSMVQWAFYSPQCRHTTQCWVFLKKTNVSIYDCTTGSPRKRMRHFFFFSTVEPVCGEDQQDILKRCPQ